MNQVHAVSRTQQGRQREPSVRDIPFPNFRRVLEVLCVEWWNSKPRFALTSERRNKNINVICGNWFKLQCQNWVKPYILQNIVSIYVHIIGTIRYGLPISSIMEGRYEDPVKVQYVFYCRNASCHLFTQIYIVTSLPSRCIPHTAG